MRINSGSLKGHSYETPKGHRTRPMSERVKIALFNSLGDISGLTVLDPFAGSGGISFEAISRGAASSQAIDIDFKAFQVIKKNIASLGLEDKVKATRANNSSWSKNNPDKKFDLLLVNPPFDDFKISTINQLVKHLKPNGLMVLSYPGREATPTVNGVVVVDNRIYGDAALSYYRLEQGSGE